MKKKINRTEREKNSVVRAMFTVGGWKNKPKLKQFLQLSFRTRNYSPTSVLTEIFACQRRRDRMRLAAAVKHSDSGWRSQLDLRSTGTTNRPRRPDASPSRISVMPRYPPNARTRQRPRWHIMDGHGGSKRYDQCN